LPEVLKSQRVAIVVPNVFLYFFRKYFRYGFSDWKVAGEKVLRPRRKMKTKFADVLTLLDKIRLADGFFQHCRFSENDVEPGH